MYLKPNKIISSKLAMRRIWVHPPEPPKSFLLSDPAKGVYLTKTKLFNVPFFWDFRKLINPHIAVVGVTGAGKSYLVKTFLTRANLTWNTNAMIIDWVGEYNDWVKQTGGHTLHFGRGEYLNLLDLAGMKPIQRVKQIISALEILTDIGKYPVQKRFTEDALMNTYKNHGFELTKKSNNKPPVLSDVIKELEKIKNKQKTEKKKDDVQECIHRLKPMTIKGNDYFAHHSTTNRTSLSDSIPIFFLCNLENNGISSPSFSPNSLMNVMINDGPKPYFSSCSISCSTWITLSCSSNIAHTFLICCVFSPNSFNCLLNFSFINVTSILSPFNV